MHLADLNWMDVDRYLDHDCRIILTTGATEQHSYLSLLTDVKIPQAIAAAVAERENVLVAPPLNFGCSGEFMAFPGTISLTQDTFDHVLMEVIHSLAQHGFAGFLILNGHGGNAMPAALETLRREAPRLAVLWHNWWEGDAMARFSAKHNAQPDHANWAEHFPFTRVGDVPKGSKPPVDFDAWQSGASAREVLGDGSFGGPYSLPYDVMRELFDALVDEAAGLVQALGAAAAY